MSQTSLRSFDEFQQRMVAKKGIPWSVSLEVTYLCNLRCTFCYNPTHEAIGEMTTEKMIYVLDELRRLGVAEVIFSGGECMSRPDIFTLLEEAQKRQFRLGMITNATFIDRATAARLKEFGFEKLCMSIHGDNAETHDRATCVPGSFEKFVKALEYLRGAPFGRELKCTVTKFNQAEVWGIKAIADRYGCTIRYDLNVMPWDNGDTTPLEERVEEALEG